MIRIARAELYELTLPLVEPFVISGGTLAERRSLIVALYDDAGHVGYGESPPFQLPFYSEETLASARDLIERVLLPRIVGREFVIEVFNRVPQFRWNALRNLDIYPCHASSMPFVLLVVKG